ncbi:hypothetical protein [Campylobacter hyointestinalis]|uniref:Toxin-antitoxin system HicB family antitoxin n=1 Tax=Campylobacter hyointestinalis subsp. hyointestinalis TaxID=91352 RepID=A0A9W5AQ86_CAMHY|nr:hypothetical protein [Campylobacter hyointestinalis]CUU73997.1 Uncharacterised protein [Campylobacter hyointestinalis subsp. hyointestinalis]CUU81822.1 Uncharacterised protein [Campylobacter hyointestinalis subsp. hyointestinalis]
MAEEKENKKLQITFNGEMIDLIENVSKRLGITVNQYIIYAVTKDLDERNKDLLKYSK